MAEQALITVEQEMATAATLYGADQDIVAFAQAVKKVAPWAQNLKNEDVGLIVRRSMAMGLDPLNPHEVQIWRDKRGSIQFQLAYTLMAEWVKKLRGDHTEPQFRQLTDVERDEEGLKADDIAFYAEFIMKDDLGKMKEMINLGLNPEEVKAMFTIRGLGVASKQEYDGEYFAPNGRSKSWKVKKRAVTDAYRCKFGTPSRPEIMELRRTGKLADVALSDWEAASGETTAEGRVRLASLSANTRKALVEIEDLSDEEMQERLEHNRAILHGESPQGGVLDGEIVEGEPITPEGIRDALRIAARWKQDEDGNWLHQPDEQQEPPGKAAQRCAAIVGKAIEAMAQDEKDKARLRHSVYHYIFGKISANMMMLAECGAMCSRWGDLGAWTPNARGAKEIPAILRAEMMETGQQEMEL